MPITKLEMQNITVFDNMSVDFCPGNNALLGENGLEKTHIMKLLYAACQSVKPGVEFPHKTVMVFRPEKDAILRLINRSKAGGNTAKVKVYSENANIGMTFTSKTKK